MVWVPTVLIAPMRLLAAGVNRAWRQQEPQLYTLDLEGRTNRPTNCFEEAEFASAPPDASAQQYSEEGAITDGLTGLKTRRHFMIALGEECRRSILTGRRSSLMMMDLDGFKQVNDRMGWSEGDKVLTVVAALLNAQSNQSAVLARYGADEFAIMTPGTSMRQVEIHAERLRAAVEADHFLRAHEVTASIGLATFPEHGQTPDEILRVADSRMHLAKLCGGNCVKVASQRLKVVNAERNEGLLEAYLEAAPEGVLTNAPNTSVEDQHRVEVAKPLWSTIAALAYAIEAKDPYRQGHSRMVSRLAARIAAKCGLSQTEVEKIRLAGLFRDIGKLYVPESVHNKPHVLTAEEFEIMKRHPVWSERILKPLNVEGILHIVRHHHERYDGKGYPDRLASDKIPLGARIVAVAECFHNMVSDLPYKSARPFEDALAELRRCSESQFDPDVVLAFFDWLQSHGNQRNLLSLQGNAVFAGANLRSRCAACIIPQSTQY